MVVRLVAEYCAVVLHAGLTDEEDEKIDRLQHHALKCIFGTKIPAGTMRSMAGIDTLRRRREILVDKFAEKCLKNLNFEHWFPRREVGRQTRGAGGEKFAEFRARCDQLFYSPLFYAWRWLNGKHGKEYGRRNTEYRNDYKRK